MFSGFYLPLLLILVALILRGVAFEYRSKRSDPTWRKRWDAAIVVGLFLPALLWGVAFANIVRGVPMRLGEQGNSLYDGGFFNLLNPYALVGWADHADAVRDARRDLPGAQDRRRDPGPGQQASRVRSDWSPR